MVSSQSAAGAALEQVPVDIPDQKPALRTLAGAQSLLEGSLTEVVYDGAALPPQAVPPWTREPNGEIPPDLVEEITAGGLRVQGTSKRPGRGMFYVRQDPKIDGAKGWALQIEGQATGAGFDNAFTTVIGNVGVGIRMNVGILFGPAGNCMGLGNSVCFPVYNGVGAVSLECKGNTIRFGSLTYTAVNGCGGGAIRFGTSASDKQYGALIRSVKYKYPSSGPKLEADGPSTRSRTVTKAVSPLLSVKLKDEQGNPAPGVKVEFSLKRSPAGQMGFLLSPTAGWSDQRGVVSVNATVGNKTGEYEVEAVCPDCDPIKSSASFLLTAIPAELVKYDGDAQLGAVGTTLARPLLVRTSDQLTDTPAQNIGVNFEITDAGGAAGQLVSPAAAASDGLGFAQTFLTLGDKPGEYSVRAYSPDAGPDAEFKACAYLPNDDFKQSDREWATTNYDNICSTEPAGTGHFRPVYGCADRIFDNRLKYPFSIGAKGCALTVLSNLINFYKETYALPIASATPRSLNIFLAENDGYGINDRNMGNVFFDKIKAFSELYIGLSGKVDVCLPSPKKSCLGGASINDLIGVVDKNLAENNPVVIYTPGHFILAVGKCGDKYVVSDPGTKQSVLYDPNGSRKIIGVRQFSLLKK